MALTNPASKSAAPLTPAPGAEAGSRGLRCDRSATAAVIFIARLPGAAGGGGCHERNMMSGDSPTLKKPAIGFELQETRLAAAITKAKNVSEKGVQFEPLDLTDETDFVPKVLSVQADSGDNKHKLCNSGSQNNNEEDLIVDEKLPEIETTLNPEKAEDSAADTPEKPEEEPNCVVNCLYYIDQCCECTIL